MPSSFEYTKCYCEENIYRLLGETTDASCPFDDVYAVVVTAFQCPPAAEVVNKWKSQVPYRPFKVKNAARDTMIWDYHVIAVVGNKDSKRYYAIDFDSQLPRSPRVTEERWKTVCIDFATYVQSTFLSIGAVGPIAAAMLQTVRFRVMAAAEYLCFLRSDRTHMLNDRGGYNASPPPQSPIQDFFPTTADGARGKFYRVTEHFSEAHKRNNLVSFINAANTNFPGDIVNLSSFFARFQ